MLSLDDNKGTTVNDLENLLNLHGEVFPMDNGYWVKFEAYQVKVSKSVPHGIRYSLTLHDKNNHMTIYTSKWILSHMNSNQLHNF